MVRKEMIRKIEGSGIGIKEKDKREIRKAYDG